MHQTITEEQGVRQLGVTSTEQRFRTRGVQQAQQWSSATGTDENYIHYQTSLGTTKEMEKTVCSSKNWRPTIFVIYY